LAEALPAVPTAKATRFGRNVWSQSKKFDRASRSKGSKTDAKRNALPWAGVAGTTQPSQQRFAHRMRARSWILALDCFA
jgi:hypothetical protein